MKRGIYIRFLVIIFITTLLSYAISTFFTAAQEEMRVRENATQICRAISDRYSDHAEASYWSEVLGGIRITIISSDGIVLDDSYISASDMKNHSQRKEVMYARKGYVATDARASDTLGRSFMYAATTMENGTILRIALPYGGIGSTLKAQLPIIAVLFFTTAIIVAFIARNFTKKVLSPLVQFIHQIEVGDYASISADSGYDEIDKITAKIHALLQEIEKAREETQIQNDKIHFILSGVKEGFIWLDDQTNIVLINKSALRVFHVEKSFTEIKFIELTRDQWLMEGVGRAINEGEDSLFEWEVGEAVYSVHISPVKSEYTNSGHNGATVLLVDVSADRISQKQRSEFFANASHELKTPITTLMGFSEMLQNGTLPEEKREGIYCRIHTETRRMNSLIGDILTISRLESGITEDCMERVNITSIAKDVVQAQELQAKEKEIDVSLTCACEDVFIQASTRRVWDLLVNLVDNAIKYNQPGGSVMIEVLTDKENAVVKVSDTGCGIRKEDHGRVFERFYRANTGSGKMIKGTGLGLAIVKHIVNSYGGEIDLKSCPDAGTEIMVKLPIKNKVKGRELSR